MEPDVMQQAWSVAQVTAVAATAGWTAERLLDTGISTRGLPLLAGLFGLYLGPRFTEVVGWASGPTVAGYPLVAAFAGALAVCGFLKLVNLAVGSRR